MPIQTNAVALFPAAAPSLMSEALDILSAKFKEMIAPQSALFHVVAVEGGQISYRSARSGDGAVPSASAGDVIVEVGYEMDLEALARTDTLSDLVCARVVANVLYDREAGARHSGVEGRFTFTTSAMYLLLSNRQGWRDYASPNDVDHVFNHDAILDFSFYNTFSEVDGRRDLQVLLDFETKMSPACLALEAISLECFEDSPQGWFPLPHTIQDIALSVGDLVDLGLDNTGQDIAPIPVAAAAFANA